MIESLEISETDQQDAARVRGRRFVINITLFLVVVVVYYLWFQFHFEHHANASRLIGGTLSIWGLFEIVHGALEWGAEDELKSLPQRILRHRNSLAYLMLALVIGAFLHACTSSIWIEYELVPGARTVYEVEVLRDGRPFIEPLKVSSAETVAGHTFFFRFRTVPLQLRFREPRGFEPRPAELKWGRRVAKVVPGEFEPKKYRLMRLLPSATIITRLPEPGGVAHTSYALELKWPGGTKVFRDVRKGVFHIGAPEEEMKDVVAREKEETRRNHWLALLPADAATTDESKQAREGVLARWEHTAVYFSTAEFKGGDRVECRLYRQYDNKTVAHAEATLTDEITDVLLAP